MRNCIAVLKNKGSFIFSLVHPCFEEPSSEWDKKRYVEVREYLQKYTSQQSFGYLFHHPLSAYINLVIQEGCMLQKMIEPQLNEELAQPHSAAERYVHVPGHIVIHAIRC